MNTENTHKYPTWTRVLDIIFRTAHVGMISVVSGGLVFGVPRDRLVIWGYFVIITGCLLIVSEMYHRRHWLYQVRGIFVIIHAGLFGISFFYPNLALLFLPLAIIIGMVGSHMPKRIRYYSLLHKRFLD